MSALATSQSWEICCADPADVARIEGHEGVTPLVARIMAGRGIVDDDEVERFLTPSLERDWEDPSCIPGLEGVADLLDDAIASGKRIAVFGDFDVDGISATCLLTCALRQLGGEVVPFIPRRFDEGYGLSAAALGRLVSIASPDVIVTVDTGIAGRAEVDDLLRRGLEVGITDHHEPSDYVPQGVPVCDPKLDPSCPSHELAGVGVALKVVSELCARHGMPDMWLDYIDLATLGTVSDLMPLRGENRSLVAEGIRRLRHTRRPGLIALAAQAHRDLTMITADDLSYSLIPRLNSAGRMADPALSLDLLMATDQMRAEELAVQLEAINQERRTIEAELTEEAMAIVDSTFDGDHVIVVGGEGWHEGVKGIVASRLTNHYHVPALLFTISEGVARGSGRSVGSIDLFHMVEQCSDLLTRFGGHAGAVGVTLEAANLDAFRDRMEQLLSKLPPEDFNTRRKVAAVVEPGELTQESVESLDVMQPFGQGNETPVLACCGVSMTDRRRRGEGGRHLSFSVTDGITTLPCIMFNADDIETLCRYDGAVDVVFDPKVETWHGRVSLKLHVRDVLMRSDEDLGSTSPDTVRLVDDLFARADEFTRDSEVTNIAQAPSFHTKVVGVSFEGRQQVVARLSTDDELLLVREPDNPHDPNAVAVTTRDGVRLGYLRRTVAAALAPEIDRGARYRVQVTDLTGGQDDQSRGVNIFVARLAQARAGESAVSVEQQRSRERARLEALSAAELTDELRGLLIGDKSLLPAQQASLDNLERGVSTLCVMATGRGKSLIFHVHAARTALLAHRASVFVYPLRALVSDQAYHLSQVFDRLGMTTRVLTGETPLPTRAETFEALAAGMVDIVLTTPEFLAINSGKFAAGGRVGFLVVDEAHHAGFAKAGVRPAYLEMPRVLEELGNPVVLAVTATASEPVAREICRLLSVGPDGVIIDPSCRDNLSIVDDRNVSGRDERLVSLLVHGEKTLVYVNSREQTVSLARMLRHRVWEFGHRVAFYNGGLTRTDRQAVEEAFRAGDLSYVIATSAFGEGVNLPDVRHVVLYHLPFDEVEFNQMSGRAGRDGSQAWVHLEYDTADARINERILRRDAPSRQSLVTLYQMLRTMQHDASEGGQDSFAATNADIAAACVAAEPRCDIDDRTVSCGISIFRELGFCETSGYGVGRRIEMVSQPRHMDLFQSIRYIEGLRAQEEFARYRDWALESSDDEILARINRPIVPERGGNVHG
ncbi:MAG: single-stranded-DNA-specific exonuclease RecJ [Coriobacteriales bacterium]